MATPFPSWVRQSRCGEYFAARGCRIKGLMHGSRATGVLVPLLLLAGCSSPTGVAQWTTPGLPDSLTQAQQSALSPDGPAAIRLDQGSRFALVTWGSSSCPAIVTALEAVGPDAVLLRLQSTGASGPCTADIAPTTHGLVLPATVTAFPVTLVVEYADADFTTSLALA